METFFCLDRRLLGRCEFCGELVQFPASYFHIRETGIGSRNTQIFQCHACANFIGWQYTLAADVFSPGFLQISQHVSGISLELLDPPQIIHNPTYTSQIEGLHPLDYERTLRVIHELRRDASTLAQLDSRVFEQVVAELVRDKGFAVELTIRTRDQGRDVVGITNLGGIPFKLFVECKRWEGTIGVDVIRSVYGVHHTYDGPNKSVIASTSYFSRDARQFVAQQAQSSWDLWLADYDEIIRWLSNYRGGH